MQAFICTTCGTQYQETETPPEACVICQDERQFVPPSGQDWTTLAELRRSHMPVFREEAGVTGIGIAPAFGINQRALIVPGASGNVLWDCISLVDDLMVRLINGIGGLAAIAISHPHYYASMVDWSQAFGGIPVYIHAADREWILRPHACLELWEGETKRIAPDLTLIRCGGHYDGGTVMHWAGGRDGRGALFSGDLLQVVTDREHIGFMRSYPNFIPLGAKAVQTIAGRIAPYAYDAIYGAFFSRVIPRDAHKALAVSVARHIEWLERDAP
jgi:hypothetical protein